MEKSGLKAIITAVCLCMASLTVSACNDDDNGGNGDGRNTTNTLKVNYCTKDQAAEFLGTSNSYTRSLSKLDFALLLGNENSTETDYLQMAAQQACGWTDAATVLMKEKTDSINLVIRSKGLKLALPKDGINVMLTTMNEAGGAGGYTLGSNMMLSSRMMSEAKNMGFDWIVTQLIAHETFHILTRTNPDFRKKMYALIGFSILPKEVEIPEELKNKLIHNPDVNQNDSYATFSINGKKRSCVMLVSSDKEYAGGPMFNYIKAKLLEIDPNTCKAVKAEDGSYKLYDIEETTDFYDKVGRNTGYVIDPEEVLADNFSYMIVKKEYNNFNTPELIEKIKAACR